MTAACQFRSPHSALLSSSCHFRLAYRAVALAEAREAERASALLASELHPPRGTWGDDIDGSNGFTTVFPSSRITILASAAATDPGLLQYDTRVYFAFASDF